jgi:dTDP-4-amino-4,6-dideoxygalactose transaminase
VTQNGYIPFAVPNVGQEEISLLAEAIETNMVSSLGPFVGLFQEELATFAKTSSAVLVSSGTAAIHVALHALGVGNGDLVATTSYSFIATANAIAMTGAEPYFIDISLSDWNLDPELLAETISNEFENNNGNLLHKKSKRRLAAIVPVHAYGTPSQIEKISSIGKKFKIPVVYDAAAALGALEDNQPVTNLSEVSCVSFNGNKTITSGAGGAVLIQNEELAVQIRHVSSTARTSSLYTHDQKAFNYRMSNVTAAVGLAQLRKLEEFVEIKKRIFLAYTKAFEETPLKMFPQRVESESSRWISGVYVEEDVATQLLHFLNERKIGAQRLWIPIHLQPPYASSPRTTMERCESIYKGIIGLPCSTSITESEIERVVESVHEFFTG